jgi:membrane protease YdiL (CAAX protease family)
MPISSAVQATFALLTLSLAALWLKPAGVPAPRWRAWAWVAPFILALATGVASGVLALPGVLVILVYEAVCYVAALPFMHARTRLLAGTALVALSGALMLHLLPGFRNPLVMDRVVLTPGAAPFSKQLNFDKATVGLFLLGIWAVGRIRATSTREVVSGFLRGFPPLVAVVLVLSVALGYVRWDPKTSGWFPLWAWSNLFLTVIAEEAFFRGMVQHTLERWFRGRSQGPLEALLLASLAFGLAHAAGGPRYVLLATVAGLGYGWIYQRTRSIGAAILAHAGLNAIHFALFTYPALASALR